MAPILFTTPPSPPARAVLMTAKYLSLELELKTINLVAGENKISEYLKINPQHTVPTLKDEDGFVIWDSHAIMPYMIEKYGKGDDILYPKDYKKRAVINQRLHFDTGVFFPRHVKVLVLIVNNFLDEADVQRMIWPARSPDMNPIEYVYDMRLHHKRPIFSQNAQPDSADLESLQEAYGYLEKFLENTNYVAGDSLSIADLSLIACVSSEQLAKVIDYEKYPKIQAWVKRMEAEPCYSANKEALEGVRKAFEEMKKK